MTLLSEGVLHEKVTYEMRILKCNHDCPVHAQLLCIPMKPRSY